MRPTATINLDMRIARKGVSAGCAFIRRAPSLYVREKEKPAEPKRKEASVKDAPLMPFTANVPSRNSDIRAAGGQRPAVRNRTCTLSDIRTKSKRTKSKIGAKSAGHC